MALKGKLKKTERLKDGDQNITYDVEFEEVRKALSQPKEENGTTDGFEVQELEMNGLWKAKA